MVCNWGIDDTDYLKFKVVDGKMRWLCPAYRDWYDLIKRVFSEKYQNKNPTYIGCTIAEEWKYFSNFRRWVLEEQPNKDWENCCLDKDILFNSNKHYSPETCAYISAKVNSFITSKRAYTYTGASPVGGKFVSLCRDPFSGKKRLYVGTFLTELEAHRAWQAKKHEFACLLAEQQQDPRVAKALRERYAPDKDWTNT